MPIKTRSIFVGILFILTLGMTQGLHAKPDEAQQRLAAGFLLAFGETLDPSLFAGETVEVFESVEAAYASFQSTLSQNTAAQQRVAQLAFLDAFGMHPDAEGAPTSEVTDPTLTYWQQLKRHTEWLDRNPAAYKDVLERAYDWVVHREVYEEEVAYWKEYPTLPFILLAGGIEDWARRNQPGLMVTTGKATISLNCDYLSTLPLSPKLASEARSAIGLPPADGRGHHIIAPAATSILSSGRIHFIPVGSEVLRQGIGL